MIVCLACGDKYDAILPKQTIVLVRIPPSGSLNSSRVKCLSTSSFRLWVLNLEAMKNTPWTMENNEPKFEIKMLVRIPWQFALVLVDWNRQILVQNWGKFVRWQKTQTNNRYKCQSVKQKSSKNIEKPTWKASPLWVTLSESIYPCTQTTWLCMEPSISGTLLRWTFCQSKRNNWNLMISLTLNIPWTEFPKC